MTLSKNHYIDMKAGRFSGTDQQDLDNLFKHLKKKKPEHLVLHFHGGLVSRKEGLKSAEKLKKVYTKAGTYPVFFIWNSNVSNIIKHFFAVKDDPLFKRLTKHLEQVLYTFFYPDDDNKHKGSSDQLILRNIPNDLNDVEEFIRKKESSFSIKKDFTADFEKKLDDLISSDRDIKNCYRLISEKNPEEYKKHNILVPIEIKNEIEHRKNLTSNTKGIGTTYFAAKAIRIAFRVVKRYRKKRINNLYQTIIEETLRSIYLTNKASTLIWQEMKEHTQTPFDSKKSAGTCFINSLKKYIRKNPNLKITLVGHSTGSVFITRFLANATSALPEIKYNVIFMAPVSTFKDLAKNLEFFENNVENVRLFGLSDALEKNYYERPFFLYKSSFLYLVSGLLEKEADMPLIGMERYYTHKKIYTTKEIKRVKKFFSGNLVWSHANKIRGRKCSAEKHGSFNEDTKMHKSLRYILQKEWI